MADDATNLVLVQLREIRSELKTLGSLEDRFDRMDQRFDEFDRKFEEWRGYVTHTLGIGSMNHLRGDALEVKLDAESKARGRLAEQIAVLDRRVTRVEERLEP